jgi:23S rRNA A1618 N6-methylase RlmF
MMSSRDTSAIIKGLDIGCGASCIYPLLGAASLHWHFVGVDVTDEALEWARKNVEMNPHLKDLIVVRKVEMQPEQKRFFLSNYEDGIGGENSEKKEEDVVVVEQKRVKRKGSAKGILAAAFKEEEEEDINNNSGEKFAFSMCNPPFFEKFEHASSNPSTAFGGTEVESVYPGGEESFVRNMFEDSLIVKDRVHWFTTMVGKKVTFKALKKWLHAEASVHVVRTMEFSQGQTSRWGVAWSFVVDPNVALKPIERGEGARNISSKEGNIPSKKRGAAGQPLEEETQLPQVKNKKITGRSVSLHLTIKDSHAALHLLKHIKSELEGSQALKCVLDGCQYLLVAKKPQGAAAAAAASREFTVQLLAQQPRRYVMTIALAKNNRTNSGTTNIRSTIAWFSGVVEQIEAVVTSDEATTRIS